MGHVISYFNDQTELEQAVEDLAESKFGDYDWEIVDPHANDGIKSGAEPIGMPAASVGSEYATPAVVNASFDSLPFGMSFNKEEADYFGRLLKQGGALLIVNDVDEEDESALVAFLNDKGGKSTDDD